MRTTTHDTDVLTEYVQPEFEAGNFKSVFLFPMKLPALITLDPKVEQEIMNAVKQTEQGSYLALDPDYTHRN